MAKLNTSSLRIIIILAIALVLRLGIWFFVGSADSGRMLAPDSTSYIQPAQTLLEAGRYSVSMQSLDIPEIIRTPGYPIYLAAIITLFGVSIPMIVISQILLGLGLIFLIYQVAESLDQKISATIAAMILVFDIPSPTMEFLVLTETLFTLLIAMMFAVGVYTIRKPNTLISYLLVGICLSLSVIVRPITYYLIFPLLIGFLLNGFLNKVSWYKLFYRICLLVIPFLLIVGGWQIRNYIVTGKITISPIQAINFVYYRAADIIAQRDRISIDEARNNLDVDNPWSRVQIDPKGDLAENWEKLGGEIIKDYPVLFLKSWLNGAFNILFGPGEGDFMTILTNQTFPNSPIDDLGNLPINDYVQKWLVNNRGYFSVFLYAALSLLIIYLGLLYWFIGSLRNKKFTTIDVFAWGLVAYIILVSSGPEAYYRFRVPLMPILAIYAARGVYQMILAFSKSIRINGRRERDTISF